MTFNVSTRVARSSGSETRKTISTPAAGEGSCWRRHTRILAAIALTHTLAATAHAQVNSWIDGNGKWESATNWSLGSPPSSTESVFITNAASKTVTLDSITSSIFTNTLVISNLTIAGLAGTTNTLSLFNAGTNTPLQVIDGLSVTNGGVLTVTNSALCVEGVLSNLFLVDGEMRMTTGSSVLVSNTSVFAGMRVGNSPGANGTFTMAGGTLTAASAYLYAGHDAGSTGTIWVTDGNINAAGQKFDVALSGTGRMTISNGTVSTGAFIVGELSGSQGTLTIAGGSLSVVGDAFIIGRLTGSTGVVWMTGGQLMESNDLGYISIEVGGGGVGQMTISNGTVRADFIGMGDRDGGLGTLTVAGGTVLTRRFILGSNSNTRSTINVIGGTLSFLSGGLGGLLIGNASGATGTVQVAGGNIVVTNVSTTVGSLGVGQVMVSTGVVLTSQTDVGAGTNTSGLLAISGGSMMVFSNLTVAVGPGSTGMVMASGGQLTATNGVIGVGNDGTDTNGFGVGTMTVSNGTVLANQVLLGSSVGGHGQLMVQTNGLVSLVGTNAVLVANDLTVDGGDVEIVNGQIFCGKLHPGVMTMSNGTANAQITYVGYDSQGTLTMVAGQMTVSSLLDIGFAAGSTGSVWMSGGQLTATALPTTIGNSGVGQFNLSGGTLQASTIVVGTTGGPGGTLTVGGGTLNVSAGLNVGSAAQSTGTVWVSGGQLVAASSSLVIGNSSGIGQMTISNGSVQANSLVLTNGANSQIALVGGALNSGGTVVTNTQQFVVGNGSTTATFNLMGGVHWFGNGLEIANNGTLTGCGTINGTVTIDSGATVLANCGGTLTFAVIVTNNGTMRAIGGSVLESYGTMVNNGTIDIINGGKSFHGAFVNNATVLDASSVKISHTSVSGQDFIVQVPSVTGHTYQLQFSPSLTPANWTNAGSPQSGTGGVLTFTDPGGATNLPSRFYRVDCTAP